VQIKPRTATIIAMGATLLAAAAAQAGVVTYQYDALGRMTKVSNQRGSLKTIVHTGYKYDARHNRTERTFTSSTGPGGGTSNHAPVAVNDERRLDLVGYEEGYVGAQSCVSLLINDLDADNDTLSITSGWDVDSYGCFVAVIPAEEWAAYDETWTYSISDGQGGTASASVRVTSNDKNTSVFL